MTSLWWVFHKDLVTELRARLAWPAMLLLGIVVALLFGVQMDLVPHDKQRLVGGLLWLAIFFAGMVAVERSFGSERDDGCWEALRLYPVSPAMIYLAKLAANVVALAVLQGLLIPLLFAFADLPLAEHAGPMLAIAVLGNLGIAAVGTLVTALAAGLGRGGSLLALVVLPLVIPVLLGAAESTRLVVEGQSASAWWPWIQLLGAFAVVFITAGTVLFEYAVEE